MTLGWKEHNQWNPEITSKSIIDLQLFLEINDENDRDVKPPQAERIHMFKVEITFRELKVILLT